MKRIGIFLLIVMLPIIPALAVSVCAKDSVVTVVLDPQINGTSNAYNNALGTWKTVFPYGNVSGVSACLDINGGSQGRTNATITAVGGEQDGQYCWCKMTHPMSSLWAFNSAPASCASVCTARCADGVRRDAGTRERLFGSVAAANAAY